MKKDKKKYSLTQVDNMDNSFNYYLGNDNEDDNEEKKQNDGKFDSDTIE